MTRSQRATDRPFTLVLCTSCGSPLVTPLLEQLRASVRRTRHGVLVTAECLVGQFTCRNRETSCGAVLFMQPCSSDRSPCGPARWVEVNSLTDVPTICAWLERGNWERNPLPERFDLNLPRVRRGAATN